MKLKLTVAGSEPGEADVVVTCDVTATIGDVARAIVGTGILEDPALEAASTARTEPLTLRAQPAPGEAAVLLDSGSQIGDSGLHSGWVVRPVREFDIGRGAAARAPRAVDLAGRVEVLTGGQAGVNFGLISGENLVGRDRGCRVRLSEPSVSRRHAVIGVEHGDLVLRDLGSANGLLVGGDEITECRIRAPVSVVLGSVEVRIVPGPPAETRCHDHPPSAALPSTRRPHRRSPVLIPRYEGSTVTLPTPPQEPAPTKIPTIALLAPILLGVAMYTFTRSAMSLVMVAFSPLMMAASWFDARFGIARRRRRELRGFEESLRVVRERLFKSRNEEIAARADESPSTTAVADTIERRGTRLWNRRPGDPAFLELRVGEAPMPSRTEFELPDRGSCGEAAWEAIEGIVTEFARVQAPALVQFRGDRGALGVAGEPVRSDGLMRALILQLAGLHSPAELSIACFADDRSVAGWRWLQWLPHVDSVTSPLRVSQLVCAEEAAVCLMSALERVIEDRSRVGNGAEAGVESILPVILVAVLADTVVETARLIHIAESGPRCGVHVLWLEREIARLPAACRSFIEISELSESSNATPGWLISTGTSEALPLRTLEFLGPSEAEQLARQLAPVEDEACRARDESDLPRRVDLRDLHDTDLLGGGPEILRAWQRSEANRDSVGLTAIVGQGADGSVSIDLRAHGPHALVGGTTGSGKSEFLQTWIMSLAARVSPERVTFLLVDYKGGAAFAECTKLPHAVGLVTDLTPQLVRRALISLRAELRRRETLLADHGAKDLASLERRAIAEAPPSLVIVIDEFAALAAEVPEFVDGVVDIAQRGRSLGLHVIMATQRPAGVISASIRANTNIRVALRFSDEAESRDVIGVPDAAQFDASTPGRAVLRSGPGGVEHFQTAHLGGRESHVRDEIAVDVAPLGFSTRQAWPASGRATLADETQTAQLPPRDIERLRDGVVEAARLAGLSPPRRPWLDPLPHSIRLSGIERTDSTVWGLRDRPGEQSQPVLTVDLDAVGNIGLFGAGGSGKSSAMIALAAALSARTAREPVHLYAVDAGGGGLACLAVLPTVSAVAPLADEELVVRILRHLLGAIEDRGGRRGSLARLVLLIDGFAALRQASEASRGPQTVLSLLSEIMAKGRPAGVHVVLSCDRASAFPPAIGACVQQRFVLRLANPHEYGYLGVRPERFDEAPPGRAVLLGDGDDIQFAILGGSDEGGDTMQALDRLASSLRGQGVLPAVPIRELPDVIRLADLPPASGGLPVIGLETRDLAPVTMPLSGLGVVAGPAGSGRTTTMLSCVAAFERWAGERGETVERVLCTLNEEDPSAAIERGEWALVARGDAEVKELASSLAFALTHKPSGDETDLGQSTFPRLGTHGVIVVERPEEAEGSNAMPALIALARAARRARVLVLFEFEQGGAGGGWELFDALKRPKWGIALQPDEAEGRGIFRPGLWAPQRRELPPGRGYVVDGGRARAVQIAVAQGILCS